MRRFAAAWIAGGHSSGAKPGNRVGVQPLSLQWLEADERRLPVGSGRNRQAASTGLYSLSNHC